MIKQVGWFQTHQEHLPQGELVSLCEGLSAGDIRNGWKQEPVFIEDGSSEEHQLKDIRCECCGYMTYHREHMGCIRAANQSATI